MKILVLSDTHIPRNAPDLPSKIYDAIKGVEMIIHAGDFVEKHVYDRLASLKSIKAVSGNMDDTELIGALSKKEIIQIEGRRIGIVHGYGAASAIVQTVKKEFSNVDCIIFGHSHNAVNVVKDGILFFNPGSATDTVFAPFQSYGILSVTKDGISGEIVKI